MSEGIYALLAPYYDLWNAELDYSAWADAIGDAIRRHSGRAVTDILDLGCGSGRMTVELARRGYGTVALDASPDMLSLAHRAAEEAGVSESCLFLLQDMTAFELYGTVDAAVSCLDTLNHLEDLGDLRATLSLVHNYLAPGGLFLFDLNSKEKFEEAYADNVYTLESDEGFLIWQNEYKRSRRIAEFSLTLFREEADGRYTRRDAVTRERMYPTATVLRELRRAGFTPLSVGSRPYNDTVEAGAERLYFVARAEKENKE